MGILLQWDDNNANHQDESPGALTREEKSIMGWTACTEITRGDVVLFPELVWDGYDPKTRKIIGERCVQGKVIAELPYDESTGTEKYVIKVIKCDGDEPYEPGAKINRTARVIFYQDKTMRKTWEDEGKRQGLLDAKADRDSIPGI